MLLAATALTGLTLMGPRMLNETEIRTQRRAPLPHTAEADAATTRRTDPVPATSAGPVTVLDICLPPGMFATPPCRAGPDDSNQDLEATSSSTNTHNQGAGGTRRKNKNKK